MVKRCCLNPLREKEYSEKTLQELMTSALEYLNSIGGDVVRPSKMLLGLTLCTDKEKNNKIIGGAF